MIQTEQYPEFDPSIAKEFGFTDTSNTLDFLGVPLFEADSIFNLLIRFGFNLLVCWILVHFFYYKKSQRRYYIVTGKQKKIKWNEKTRWNCSLGD